MKVRNVQMWRCLLDSVWTGSSQAAGLILCHLGPQQTTSASTALKAPPLCPMGPPLCSLAPPTAPPLDPFEYYDAGNHWCHNCNVTSGSMFDFFTHCHSKSHRKVCVFLKAISCCLSALEQLSVSHLYTPLTCRFFSPGIFWILSQTLDPYERPWASTSTKTLSSSGSEERLSKPAKGRLAVVNVSVKLKVSVKLFTDDPGVFSHLLLPGGVSVDLCCSLSVS